MRTIRDIDLNGKRVLMRVDFNVPMDDDGRIIDDTKMTAAIPTLNYVLEHGARLVLMSHLGRPKAKPDPAFSLGPVAVRLRELLKRDVLMADDCIGPAVEAMAASLGPGQVMMLENVRFHAGEEKNDPEFSRQLAKMGDVFVNDAFGSAHRAHSSTVGVADYLPAYAGFLLETEVKMLRQVLEYPQAPRMAILGGAKVKDKLGLIRNLLSRFDILLVAGGIGNTFLAARGRNIGQSLHEPEFLKECSDILDIAAKKHKHILMPVDAVVADKISADAESRIVDIDQIPDNLMIADIGPKTVTGFAVAIGKAKTIIWNGPVGVYEYPQFAHGTDAIAKAIASSEAVSVIGGGDSAAAIQKLGLEEDITHISTGGGATLEFLEGIELPGVKVCERSEELV
ncbi:MAG TPA: phosphoglycerate kinase [Syntrophomonadaceae bacterium]|nr:phosphoglycerate kinase [Syntrophomonadaceae bacterium]